MSARGTARESGSHHEIRSKPAVHLATTSAFDANPSGDGLPSCAHCDPQSGRCPTTIDED